MASERDTLREELASTQSLLQGAKEEACKFKALHAESAAALSSTKFDADVLIFSYREDAAAANTRAIKISEEAELKLARALAHARLEARRQAFEEVHAKGFDLSTEIKEAKALEEESAASNTSDEGYASISEFFEVRPSPFKEEEGPSVSEIEKDNKRKTCSMVINAPGEDDSTLMAQTRRPPETVESASNKLKSELLHREVKLRKALNGEISLRLLLSQLHRKTETLEHLRGKANQVNSECNDLKAQIDAHVAAKRNALSKAFSIEIQLRNARESNFVQASKVAKLETDLSKMKAEVVDAGAEAEEVRAKANKKVTIYLKDAAEAHTKLRGASDRERRSNEYAQCRSWRETLKEIHGKGIDLSEEIEQGKVDEFDAKFLDSNAEDNEKEAGEGVGPEGTDGDIVPKGGRLSSRG
ncbi:uncharacterized protein [Nicotiana sylvestris]|uniref:uncharacterized protein n=1 Tax=Nicotiana sylvestris TaxID=4096 RepID=UPI00388CB15E